MTRNETARLIWHCRAFMRKNAEHVAVRRRNKAIRDLIGL